MRVLAAALAFTIAAASRATTAWIAPVVSRRATLQPLQVESFSLDTLSDDHETIGSELASSMQRMLDTEWMPQQVHSQVSERIKQTYIRCRENGEDDLMAVMTEAADDLSEHWKEYDKDMFVGVYDLANYMSDYLITKSGEDGCSCTQKIY